MNRTASKQPKRRPGEVRDAVISVLQDRPEGATIADITRGVERLTGRVHPSSVRSYLRLNTPAAFRRVARGRYALQGAARVEAVKAHSPAQAVPQERIQIGNATLYRTDCFDWLRQRRDASIHAVVTDPPYGLIEYSDEQQQKLRTGKGGVWRIPPSFDGVKRAPLPRFTVLTSRDLLALQAFFLSWGKALLRVLVPGANVVVASNPLLSHLVASSLAEAGLERRGELVRLVMTMRGGDRPKAAHLEFADISVMPRSMWEPWLLFRRPLEGRVQDNLRRWKTGGFRRPSKDRPFGDVIRSSPTHALERRLAPHPSLKPQSFLRALVRGVLPTGEGIVLDPFAGSGSTLAAAEALGYRSIGVERDPSFFSMARNSIPLLRDYKRDVTDELSL